MRPVNLLKRMHRPIALLFFSLALTTLSPAYHQVIPIALFSVTNFYLNYTLRNGTRFDQTKFRLSLNNLFDNNNIVGVQQAAAGPVYKPGSGDLLSTLPGRSITLSVTFGYSPGG
jgi:iron complex outermembrane receptor protein